MDVKYGRAIGFEPCFILRHLRNERNIMGTEGIAKRVDEWCDGEQSALLQASL